MRNILAAALLVAGIGGISAANAMPLAPMSAADTASVIQVAQGCGPGFARGPMGACRRIAGWGGPPPRRFCPPGTFRGPYGGCRRRW